MMQPIGGTVKFLMCFARKFYWLKTKKIKNSLIVTSTMLCIVQEHANSLFYVSVTFLVIAAAVSTTVRVYRTAYNLDLKHTTIAYRFLGLQPTKFKFEEMYPDILIGSQDSPKDRKP